MNGEVSSSIGLIQSLPHCECEKSTEEKSTGNNNNNNDDVDENKLSIEINLKWKQWQSKSKSHLSVLVHKRTRTHMRWPYIYTLGAQKSGFVIFYTHNSLHCPMNHFNIAPYVKLLCIINTCDDNGHTDRTSEKQKQFSFSNMVSGIDLSISAPSN